MFNKEKREEKRKLKDPYYLEETRLTMMLNSVEPGSEAYKELQNELRINNQMRAESRESKRRISKSDKGGIIIKVLSILGAGAGIGSIIYAEHKGMVFSGEKRKFMDSVASGFGKIFTRG